MTIPRRIRIAAILVVIAAVLSGLAWQHRERVRLQIVAENARKAEALKSALDARFPVGTPESDVVAVLDKERPGYARAPGGSWVDYAVPVGTEPSDVWYCGSWTRGVMLHFESGRLVRSTVTRWSVDCL
jgi:hypothetical protein